MPDRALVEAPDAFAGFLLAARLRRVDPNAHVEPDGDGVWVTADVGVDVLPSALHIVQAWLREERIAGARVRLSDREFLIAA